MSHAEILKPEDFFSAAVFSNPDIISVSRLADGSFLQVNEAFLEMSGYSREEVIGKTSNDLGIWTDASERDRFVVLLAREGRVRDLGVHFRMRDGELRNFRMSAALVHIGVDDCISASCRDVSPLNEMVERLEKGRFLLERAEEMADIGSWEFDFATGKVSASQGACRIYGLEPGEFTIGAVEAVPLPEYRPFMDRARDGLIRDGTPYDVEFRIARKRDGAIRDIHSKARWDPVNRRLFGIIRDVTEAKETAAGLRRAIAEKETLIKELYHRTKNNMQVVSSLLGMEADRSGMPELRDTLDEMQRRIDAMALVHEMLYQANDLSRIRLEDFIPALVELLKSGLGDHEGRIGFIYEIDDVELSMDEAVPCGIILNELLTNSLVHAFPGERRGTVRLRAERDAQGLVAIEVRDDGIGIPEDYDYREGAKHLGLSLVTSIGRSQLRGSVEIQAGPGGFGCRIAFKDGRYADRP